SADSIDVITLSQISSSFETLAFNTTFGDSAIAKQTLTLSNISVNWQATASAPWLILTPQSDDNGERILIDIDVSLITGWGLMTARISIYDPASGSTKVITVDLAVDAIRLSSNYPLTGF
ncbi:MAG: hypothetical protein ACJAXH_003040, partial [Colwellia sp.]